MKDFETVTLSEAVRAWDVSASHLGKYLCIWLSENEQHDVWVGIGSTPEQAEADGRQMHAKQGGSEGGTYHIYFVTADSDDE